MEDYQIIKKGSRQNGIDEKGVDKTGVDKRGVDEMGRYWGGSFFYKKNNKKTDWVEEDNVQNDAKHSFILQCVGTSTRRNFATDAI